MIVLDGWIQVACAVCGSLEGQSQDFTSNLAGALVSLVGVVVPVMGAVNWTFRGESVELDPIEYDFGFNWYGDPPEGLVHPPTSRLDRFILRGGVLFHGGEPTRWADYAGTDGHGGQVRASENDPQSGEAGPPPKI